jgi:hypothetical protein
VDFASRKEVVYRRYLPAVRSNARVSATDAPNHRIKYLRNTERDRCDTNAKNLLLGIFVTLTVVFASLTVGEYYQVDKTISTTITTSITTITSTIVCPSSVTCGSFTYTQDGQVQVDNVQAMESTFQNGGLPQVTFYATVENIGNTPISFPSYALESSIATNDSVLQKQVVYLSRVWTHLNF